MFLPICPILVPRSFRPGVRPDSATARNQSGRAFVLFTSYAQMKDIYQRLLGQLEFPMLLQGDGRRMRYLRNSGSRRTPYYLRRLRSGRAWTCRGSN